MTGRSLLLCVALLAGVMSLVKAQENGPCASALRNSAVCEAANNYALERIKAGKLEAIVVMQGVKTGGLVAFAASDPAKFDVAMALLPLSPVKLMAAASWMDHDGAKQADSEKLLTDSIVSGNDNAGRQIASAVRKTAGTEKVLDDLARYGFPAGRKKAAGPETGFWSELAPQWRERLMPAASYHSLDRETTTKDWEDTLSIGEERFVTTALQLSRFLQAVGNGGRMMAPVAREETAAKSGPGSAVPAMVVSETTALKLQEVMRGAVERGTAKSARPILAETGWTMGGKTGTGPEPNSKMPGPGSTAVFPD